MKEEKTHKSHICDQENKIVSIEKKIYELNHHFIDIVKELRQIRNTQDLIIKFLVSSLLTLIVSLLIEIFKR